MYIDHLEETRFLLKEHQLTPKKSLGQNFLIDFSIYPKLSSYAALEKQDIVLDAGAGFGFLARFLADKCKKVLAVEKDQNVVKILHEQLKDLANIVVIEGDVLKLPLQFFNKIISIPPYYISSKLILWILDLKIHIAVLVVQKEFAKRLIAPLGSKEYGWLSVIASQCVRVELLDNVPARMFYPQPEVDSIIIRVTPWAVGQFEVKDFLFFRKLTKWLFTQRNKKLANALLPFIKCELGLNKSKAGEIAASFLQCNKRVRELTPKEFGEIANELSR